MSEMDDLPRDPNAAPIFDANGEPWAPPDPEECQKIIQSDMDAMLVRACEASLMAILHATTPLLLESEPRPVRAKRFDDWITRTTALLEECAERKQ